MGVTETAGGQRYSGAVGISEQPHHVVKQAMDICLHTNSGVVMKNRDCQASRFILLCHGT